MTLNVFLMGGGTRLAAHLGALEAISQTMGEVRRWAGASAGSLISAVRASGYSHDQAVDLMLSTSYRQFFDLRPLELIRGYGLCSGRRLEKWLDTVLQGRRFGDLDTPLSVVCTDIVSGEPFVFSNERTPEANVAEAVRCSVGIPGLFAVRKVKDAVLVDGGLTPIDESSLFPDDGAPTLTIRLMRDRTSKPMRVGGFGWAAYAQRIASLLLDAGDDPRYVPTLAPNVVTIRTGHHSSVDFDLAADDKRELYTRGYEQCLEMLKRHGRTRQVTLDDVLDTVDAGLNDTAIMTSDTAIIPAARDNGAGASGASTAPPADPRTRQPSIH